MYFVFSSTIEFKEEGASGAMISQVIENTFQENTFNEYFAILRGCDWKFSDGMCQIEHDGTGELYAYYTLKKPLKLKGEVVFENLAQFDECDQSDMQSRLYIESDSKGFDFLKTFRLSVNSKQIAGQMQSQLPKWFLDGVAGEVRFQVSFEVENREEDIASSHYDEEGITKPHRAKIALALGQALCDFTTSKINVKNLQIRKISEKIVDKKAYQQVDMLFGYGLILEDKDKFVNLRQSPNGKILTQIPTSQKDNILLIGLIDKHKVWRYYISQVDQDTIWEYYDQVLPYVGNNKNEWHKVLYFPPNINKTESALIGYIHKSQVEKMSYDEAEARSGRQR